MTEEEWLAATDPAPMLRSLARKPGDRKVRLFAVGCCWRVTHLLEDERCRSAVEVSENYADNHCSKAEVIKANRRAKQAWELLDRRTNGAFKQPGNRWAMRATASLHVRLIPVHVVDYVANAFGEILAAECLREAAKRSAEAYQTAMGHGLYEPARAAAASREKCVLSNLVRCTFGNPFRPVTVDPSCVTPTVLALATGIYSDRAFDHLPILADALQDAGCDNDDILSHCRSDGPHARGCWVVDLLTGRG